MNKRFKIQILALLLSFAAAVSVAAQNVPSTSLIGPSPNRMGSQLVYFIEEGTPALRGTWKSYLAVTNMNITTAVDIHLQFYSLPCSEMFDFADTLAPGKTWVYDPAALRRAFDGAFRGAVPTSGRYVVTITALKTPFDNDFRGYSFNWLSGQFWIIDLAHSASDVHNAAARPAVDGTSTTVADGLLLDGSARWLQKWQPSALKLSSFWPTSGVGAVREGVPFGNRLTFLSFNDDYSTLPNWFRIQAANATLDATAHNSNGAGYALSSRTVSGLTEFTIAPNPAGAPGNFPDFLEASTSAALSPQGGWISIQTTGLPPDGNLLSWFSQQWDTAPPVITELSASPGVLWPPNHKMVLVRIKVAAKDDATASPVCSISSVTSNEPIDGLGDGDTAPDWLVTGALGLQLRAERGGQGSGRIYTVTVSCSDEAGNTASRSTTVTVPHDMK